MRAKIVILRRINPIDSYKQITKLWQIKFLKKKHQKPSIFMSKDAFVVTSFCYSICTLVILTMILLDIEFIIRYIGFQYKVSQEQKFYSRTTAELFYPLSVKTIIILTLFIKKTALKNCKSFYPYLKDHLIDPFKKKNS